MAETFLDRLSKKYTPKKMKPVEIKLEKGQLQVDVKIADETDTGYDISSFRDRLHQHRGVSIIVPKEKTPEIQLTIQDIAVTDTEDTPKKLDSKLKLPGRKKMKIDKSKIKKRKKRTIEEIRLDIEPSLIQIDDRPIGDRIKEKEPSVNIKLSAYYLNNREYFVNFINSMFRKYSRQLEKDSKNITCDSVGQAKGRDFSLMTHQQIVRDYINVYTPYRGLLLYHGLGAGKTCASIAIAEGIKDTNQIIVMTPASLRMNYISELKHCGDPIYKINQYWEKIITKGNPHLEKALSETLNLPITWVRDKGWVWMVDVKKPSNFEKLSPDDQKSIDKQINEMILKKYKFINYNGIRNSHLNKLIREASNKDITDEELEDDDLYTYKNPFDDKVIIIDEAHNFVSRIVNKIKNKKASLSIKLYELILRASNCRVIFLTGTPVINYPNEIGVLFNMLRGYIKTFHFKSIDTSEAGETVNQAFMQKIFKKEKLLDYMDYNPTRNTLTITRNPFGFVNTLKKKKGSKDLEYGGVNNKSKFGQKNDNEFIRYIKSTLKKNNININPRQIEIKNYKALPDLLDTFKDMFIDSVTGEMRETNHFKRRILGMTSYFRSAQESLLPKYEDTPQWKHVEKIPMSNYQVGIYEKARKAERKEEDRNKRKKAQQQDGIYAETSSSYRIFSRAFCNFVFPNEIIKDDDDKDVLLTRPMPQADQTIDQAITTRKSDEEGDKPKTTQEVLDEDIMDGAELQEKLENRDGLYSEEDAEQIQRQVKDLVDTSYKSRINNALYLLKKHGDKYLSPIGLQEYGPKFLRVLQNIINPATSTESEEGLHLIYTQFRTMEGVGILSLILEQNGFARFKISKKTGAWRLNMTEEDLGKPTYALYTGTETAEEKEIIRNVFNSSWDSIPSSLSKQLKVKNKNNYLGEIIKVLMITSSGSEGITLKNTRFVHLIEPYWHPVRTDQVIGRARRICSHKDLPDSLKTVEVFVYLMTFTEEQIKGNPDSDIPEERKPLLSRSIRDSKSDKSKIDKTTLFTSDETLYEISNIKKNTTDSILRAIKSSSIDCFLHNKSNNKEGIMCYTFGSPSVNTFSYKPNLNLEEGDKVEEQNYEGKIWTGYPIKIEGIKRAIKRAYPNPQTKLEKKIGLIYDLDSYMLAKEGKGDPVLLGRTRINPKKPTKIQFLSITDPDFNEK